MRDRRQKLHHFFAIDKEAPSDKRERLGTLISGAALMLAVVTSLTTALLTLKQMKNAGEVQREASARTMWMEFLKYTATKPRYACPKDGGKRYVDSALSTSLAKPEEDELQEYVAYTVLMLSAFENVIEFVAEENEQEWIITFNGRLQCHDEYLSSQIFMEPQTYCSYSKKLRVAIDKVVREKHRNPPRCPS